MTITEPRSSTVLDSALITFTRFGYRKTSMDEVAKAAGISRPGLYFLFDSKEELFRAAVTRALHSDIAEVERILGESGRPVSERLLASFDRWAGRHIGPIARDTSAMIDDNPELLGSIVESAPLRFEELITIALAAQTPNPVATAQTLISASIGIKHQVDDRAVYLERLAVAIDLLVR